MDDTTGKPDMPGATPQGLGEPVDVIFRDARVIDPASGTDRIADVWVLEGRLVRIGEGPALPPEKAGSVRVVDASGKWIVPGLIDMHVHLREPGEEYKETIATGTRAAVAGGFTSVACMPNTRPVNDCAAVTELILRRTRDEGSCRVFPVAAVSPGLKGENLTEFAELHSLGVVAFSDDGRPVAGSVLMRRALEYAGIVNAPIICHAEDPELSKGGLMNEGPTATMLGLRGIPTTAEELMVGRDILLAELTGGRVHFAHVSCAGSVRLIRDAKRRGLRVTCETAPHYFTLTDEVMTSFDPVFKVNPPLRSRKDLEAIEEGLADGTIDAVATDHAPHSILEKDTEFEYAANGMIGLESALPLVLELVRRGVLSPMDAMAKLTCNPARILGLPLGSLCLGELVDLTLIDPDVPVVVNAAGFESKSRNCPFHGRETHGRALLTLVNGRTAWSGL